MSGEADKVFRSAVDPSTGVGVLSIIFASSFVWWYNATIDSLQPTLRIIGMSWLLLVLFLFSFSVLKLVYGIAYYLQSMKRGLESTEISMLSLQGQFELRDAFRFVIISTLVSALFALVALNPQLFLIVEQPATGSVIYRIIFSSVALFAIGLSSWTFVKRRLVPGGN